MKAIVYDRFGGPEVLHSAELPIPLPGPHEIQVQVAYTAVNPVDWRIREGQMKEAMPHGFPLIPGWDVSGIVTSVGSASSLYKVGDNVYALAIKPRLQWGTYAEFVVLDEKITARMPRNLGFKDAAAIPLSALTAWQALVDHAHLKAGETILILGGAGGVGTYALQMTHNIGAGVLTTASLRNHDLVRSLGANLAIDYAREDLGQAVHQHAKEGVDVVLDLIGGEAQRQSFQALKSGGRLISTVDTPDQDLAQSLQITAKDILVQPNRLQLSDLALQFEESRLKIPPLREYDLKDAAAAQSLSQTGHVQGKIVLKVK